MEVVSKSGLTISKNTKPEFKFKNKGFCGDLSERFLIRNSFIGDKALKGDWMMDVKQLNHNEGTQWCRQNIGDDGQKCRYPSITEMVSLLSSNKTKDQGFITEEFINTNQEKFWSQTPLLPARTSGWFIDFNYGTISFMQAKRKLSVRCFCPWEEAKKLK